MDDFLDDMEDLLDPTTPQGVVFVAGSGLLDDDRDIDGERCACWCGCRRKVRRGGDECSRCWEGTHRDDR
jgi:hypothetical protein